jgi:hypothetical protein
MSGNEIAGLQAIAKAHGGSLTINPETGLAEAGFLDSLMPMIVGAGLAYATGGSSLAASGGLFGMGMPATIGMGVGALQTARTGDLGKGLMAGLGAYGGAGMLGAAEGAGMLSGAEGSVPPAPNVAPTSFSAAPTDMTAYAPTPTQYGAFGEAPGAVSSVDPSSYGAFGEAPPVSATAPVSDAAQQAASKAMGSVTVAPPAPTIGDLIMQNKGYAAAAAAPPVMDLMSPKGTPPEAKTGMIRPYTFEYNKQTPTNPIGTTRQAGQDTSERQWFQPQYTALPPYKAAEGGLLALAGGGSVEQMSNANSIGANTGYPMADVNKAAYSTPYQTPVAQNVVQGSADTGVNPMTGEQNRFAAGGISTLGGYSDGGRLLKGPGDGMSDNIPAQIGAKQPARLADGEFVVPADVVSHLGNGSTDAGAKQLYKMMDRIRAQRTGKKKQAPQVNPSKAMPA